MEEKTLRCNNALNYQDLGGTIRSKKPNDTLRDIKKYTEIAQITRLADITGLDVLGVPVYTCTRPNAKSLSTSQGKGLSHQLAQCGAYMEAIELHYAENILPDFISSYEAIWDGNLVLNPKSVLSNRFKISEIEKITIPWINGIDLINDERVYLPLDPFNLDLTRPMIGMFQNTSTGLASGNDYLEAICHSLYEIIERNCCAEFRRYSAGSKNELIIDQETIDFMPVKELIISVKSKNIVPIIFDITNVFDVPAFYCLLSERNILRKVGVSCGSGCHHNKHIALSRAFTEAIQARLTYISGIRDDIFPNNYYKEEYFIDSPGKRNYADIHTHTEVALDKLYILIMEKILKMSLKVYSVCHTHKNDAISVVHSIVPGLSI